MRASDRTPPGGSLDSMRPAATSLFDQGIWWRRKGNRKTTNMTIGATQAASSRLRVSGRTLNWRGRVTSSTRQHGPSAIAMMRHFIEFSRDRRRFPRVRARPTSLKLIPAGGVSDACVRASLFRDRRIVRPKALSSPILFTPLFPTGGRMFLGTRRRNSSRRSISSVAPSREVVYHACAPTKNMAR
jgi:hypothetical protein